MIDQILLITGAAIFGVLGSAHLFLTFLSDSFQAFDGSVTEAMKKSAPKLTKETTMWKAWIGFNASHSFGAILVAAFYIPLALANMAVIRESIWLSLLPAIVGFAYLYVAYQYWFRKPFAGIAIATICFVAAALFINLP